MFVHAAGVQQRKHVGVAGAVADRDPLVEQHRVAAAVEDFGFRAVQPEAVPPLRQNRRDQQVPVRVAGGRVRRVVIERAGDDETLARQFLLVGRLRIHHRPDRNDGVDVLVVQRPQRAGDVGVRPQVLVGVVGIALVLPPEPVLHHDVQRHVLAAVLAGDIEQLLRRLVAILRLEEPVGPLAEQRRVSGDVAVLMDHRIDFRAVDEVVVDGIGGVGRELELGGEAVVEPGPRRRVPKDAVSIGTDQQRHRDVRVRLAQLHHRSAIVEHAILVLAQPVQPLAGVGEETLAHAVETFAVHLGAFVAARLTIRFRR